jgi:hypothetical protein
MRTGCGFGKFQYTYLLHGAVYFLRSWEANRVAASQEVPHILLNLKVHYCIHNCSPPVSILSQPNPVHTPTSYFLKIHSNIIPPPTNAWVSPAVSLPQVYPPKPYKCLSPPSTVLHAPPVYSSWFYHPHNIGRGVLIMKLLIMKFSPLPLPCPSWAQIFSSTPYKFQYLHYK